VRLTTQSSDASHEKCCKFGNDYGDYVGLNATSGIVVPAWTDLRVRGAQLYTATVPAGSAQ
jgi:hypothetical protein